MKKRIWELDALRGFCVFCMLFVHLFFDLRMFGVVHVNSRNFLVRFFFEGWGGALFFLISGISATLGSRSVRRGLMVAGAAALVSAVTYGMDLLGFSSGMGVAFGVLHCLAVCMLLWPLFGKLPQRLLGQHRHTHTALLAVFGIVFVALGLWLRQLPAPDHNWLMVLGLPGKHFASGDYFPVLPYFGFFLLGSVAGRLLYATKESRLPRVSERNPLRRFFCWFGIHSLPIYLIHQPVNFLLAWAVAYFIQNVLG